MALTPTALARAPSRTPSVTAQAEPAGARAPDPALEGLLRDLGPQLRRGGPPGETRPLGRCPTGVPAIDRLLGGGFPRGRLCEVAGPAGGGRTSLALAALAHTTAPGGFAALLDAADAFDPRCAAEAGVDLARLLWVRAPGALEARRGAERLLATRGFSLLLLDLSGTERGAPSAQVWLRLRKAAAATDAALVVLGETRQLASFADIALELGSGRPRFTGMPPLLEGLDAEVRLARSRLSTEPAAPGPSVRTRCASVQWNTPHREDAA